eukprot:symbB.v1.2.003034.t1/scaffold168.1/size289517/12
MLSLGSPSRTCGGGALLLIDLLRKHEKLAFCGLDSTKVTQDGFGGRCVFECLLEDGLDRSDTSRVSTACGCINMLWSAPLQLTIALIMLWRQLGLPVLAGICCMFAMLAAQISISKYAIKSSQMCV